MKITRKYPNTSVISILTLDTDVKHSYKVIFISANSVPDYYTDENVYWYDGAGKNCVATYIWKGVKLRQWFGCGKDEVVHNLYDQILATKEMTIENTILKFDLPEYTIREYKPQPFYDRSQNYSENLIINDKLYIPQLLLQEENIKVLSGYAPATTDIKHLFPVGLYDDNYLHGKLNSGIIGVKDFRKPYLTFHGVRNKDDKNTDIKTMIGFYQENFIRDINYEAVFYNDNGDDIGRSEIDHANGIFQAIVTDTSGKGSVAVLKDGTVVKSNEYVLLKSVTFDSNLASGSFIDAYGRDYLVTAQDKERPDTLESYTFQRDLYAKRIDADMKLSDKFKEIFNYLGPKIVIADPYFFNNVTQDSITKSISLTSCQQSFLNALAWSAATVGINQLHFLGYNTRANKHFDKEKANSQLTTTSQRFNLYETLFKEFIRQNKLSKYLPSSSVYFKNAPKDFHNRYWFSLSEDDSQFTKCVSVTNSIGIMDEVDFFPITNEMQRDQINQKYIHFYRTAINELIV